MKLDILQLPKDRGGWGLPKIESYVLSIHARIAKEFEQAAPPWLEIGKTFCTPFFLVNFVR